jgi:hypothetical protein
VVRFYRPYLITLTLEQESWRDTRQMGDFFIGEMVDFGRLRGLAEEKGAGLETRPSR